MPWCYTTDPEKKIEMCEVPYCTAPPVRRKCGTLSQSQTDYRGDIDVSENGLSCIQWVDSVEAVTLGYTPTQLPWDGLVAAYCRNPAGTQRSRAWCYTGLANESTWEYCNTVPDCKECGSPYFRKQDYLGTASVTRSGQSCVSWLDKEAHLLLSNLTATPFELEENYCRNPGGTKEGVWCYTSLDGDEFDFCDVPDCKEEVSAAPSSNETCGSLSVQQSNYRGSMNVTETGKACQAWSSQVPHAHKLRPEDRPIDGLDGNTCRNPDNSERAWCFTQNSAVLWEYCDVPAC